MEHAKNSFDTFLHQGSPQSSNKAPSYVKALELLGPILERKASGELRVGDIWAVQSPQLIRRLYEYVCEERKKGEDGIFAGEEPRSYWEGGFMSAALRSYLEFRVTRNHNEQLRKVFGKNQNRDPQQISEILQQQTVENIEELVPPGVDVDYSSWEGKEVLRLCKARVNQRFFRDLILDNYQSQCCLTGIAVPDLLIASHIVPGPRG